MKTWLLSKLEVPHVGGVWTHKLCCLLSHNSLTFLNFDIKDEYCLQPPFLTHLLQMWTVVKSGQGLRCENW